MGSITVRNLDDDVKKRLRLRAAEHGRSLEAEVREILRRSASLTPQTSRTKTGLDLFRGIRKVVEAYGGVELEIPPRTPMRDLPFQDEPATFRRTDGKRRKLRPRKK